MRYLSEPPTSALSGEGFSFVADENGLFRLEGEAADVAIATFSRLGIQLTPHPDDLAEAEAKRQQEAAEARAAAEAAEVAARLAAEAEMQRKFDEAVEREVQKRLAAAEAARGKKAPAKPAD